MGTQLAILPMPSLPTRYANNILRRPNSLWNIAPCLRVPRSQHVYPEDHINDNVMQPTTMPRQFGMRIHQSCNMTPHTNHNQLDAKETKHSSTWGKFSSCNRMVLPVKVHPFAGSDCSTLQKDGA